MNNKDFETLWAKSRRGADIEPCPLADDDIKKHIAAAIAANKEARQTAKTRKRFAPKLVLRIAAAAACVAAIAVGFWKISTDAVPTMPTYDMLQPTQVAQAEVPAKQQTLEISTTAPTYSATTDNEIKNTAVKPTYKHTETMYAEHKSDIDEMSDILFDNTAAAAIVQEPVPVLLAEAEIQLEQNYTAIDNTNTLSTDTILQLQTDLPKYETNYLAYADTANNNNHIPNISNKTINEELCSLNMITYCNIRCNSDNVTEIIINNLMIV